jgi:hypothetical protein
MTAMTRRDVLLRIGGLTLSLSLAPAVRAAGAASYNQWFIFRELGGQRGPIEPAVGYRLANSTTQSQLRWDGANQHAAGVYWGWIGQQGDKRSEGAPQTFFQRRATTSSPDFVRQNELIALEFRPQPGFLLYKHADEDYNLGWKSAARVRQTRSREIYQWRLTNVLPNGADHRSSNAVEGQSYALYNTVARKYLLVTVQPRGRLQWLDPPS